VKQARTVRSDHCGPDFDACGPLTLIVPLGCGLHQRSVVAAASFLRAGAHSAVRSASRRSVERSLHSDGPRCRARRASAGACAAPWVNSLDEHEQHPGLPVEEGPACTAGPTLSHAMCFSAGLVVARREFGCDADASRRSFRSSRRRRWRLCV
jgi:hypothetical protein